MSSRYNHKVIEKKWQQIWSDENVFKTIKDHNKKDFILSKLSTPTPERILYIGQALRDGISIKDIYG